MILINKLVTLEGCNRCVEIAASRNGSLSMLDERYNARNNQVIKICLALGIEPNDEDRFGTPEEEIERQNELIRAELKAKKKEEADGR